jgi:hypothetical protein
MADRINMTPMTGSGMHPKLKNLGTYAHPSKGGPVKTGAFPDHRPKTGELKKVLKEKPVPRPQGAPGMAGVGTDYADFKPKPGLAGNPRLKQKQVASQLQNGGANANLASFNDSSYDTSPFSPQAQPTVKQKQPRVKKAVAKGVPFFGNI